MPNEFSPPSAEKLGELLKIARNNQDMTLQNVSDRLGLPISTLSEIEHGKRKTTSVELFRFSKLYNRSVDFFLRDYETNSSFAVLLRAIDETAISKAAIMQFQDLCNNYSFLKKLLKIPDAAAPPDYSRSEPTTSDAENIAEAERSSLGLNGQPIRDIADLLESKRGIKIFHMDVIGGEFSGALASDDCYGSCFLINANNPSRRRFFTIAHEYAHCIAHRNQLAHLDYERQVDPGNRQEKFADSFAAAFLMPRGSVLEFLSNLKSNKAQVNALTILQVAIYFGVSFEAAGWRLVALQQMTAAKWNEIIAQHIPSSPIASILGYSNNDNKPDMLPRQYKYLCYKAYGEGEISLEKLAELLNRNYYDLKTEFETTELQS
jgi:Zn-dependent peptidase ImmA (M78 family)/transcriptional regulator with XRE-family HTH domain